MTGSAGAASQTFSIQSQAQIPTILELAISQTGASELRFGNIRPSALDATEAGPLSIIIDVTSNIGSRYQVTQAISGPLLNASGDEITPDHLTFTTTSTHSTGSAVGSPTVVVASSQAIYTSNPQGASDSIRADYKLTIPPSQAPGDYSAQMTYTVSSL